MSMIGEPQEHLNNTEKLTRHIDRVRNILVWTLIPINLRVKPNAKPPFINIIVY